MDTKESILLEIIPKIKEYLSAPDSGEPKSHIDFISRNKNLFVCNLYNVNIITEDDIRLLYLTIEQNMGIDDQALVAIFSYIGYKFEKNIQEENSSIGAGDKITDEMTYNMYDLFFNTLDVYIRQKHVNILVNNESSNDVAINYHTSTATSLDVGDEQLVNEIPINMKELLNYVSKNIDQMRFSKKYLDFAYLCRNIGIRISKKKFNVRYVYRYVVDDLRIPVVIKDYLDVRYVYLEETDKVYRNNFEDNGNLAEWGRLLIPRLTNRRLYSYFFLSSYSLCDLFLELVSEKPAAFRPAPAASSIPVVEPAFWRESAFVEFRPCEHQVRLTEVLRVDLSYYEKINRFISEFIAYEDGIAYCIICGINVPLFNRDAADVTKNTVLVVTHNKSIFMSEPYNYFAHSQRFIFNTIMSFDTIMKSQMWSVKYNINRMILNLLISINNNRQEYEKRFAGEIKKGIFFLRLAANLFDIHMSSMELFYSAKVLNIHYIVALVIVLNSSADFIMTYLSGKKKPVDTENLNYAISVIIFDFLEKTRICDKKQLDTILLFTDTYMSIVPDELLAHYNRIRAEMARLVSIRRSRRKPNYDVDNYAEMPLADAVRFFPSTPTSTAMFYTSLPRPVWVGKVAVPTRQRVPTTEDASTFEEIMTANTRVLIRVNDTNAMNMVFFTTHLKIEIEKKKIIVPLKKLFVSNTLKYYSTIPFYVFKFGDPFPFDSTLINEEHVRYKVNGYNYLLHALVPDSDIFVYFDTDLRRYNLEFAFYMFLSNYVDVKSWIEENGVKIRDLYIINFNN
ncbi:RAP94 [Eastern grey kangaroopox virus]|uniref:RNA polymerase-associated transcription-specificity factor RAP94 n=1 Tax=Eastern grey kangaroopox virus TaxID=2042482 RepID=A0A2C9DT50_9POXV|nr:RAP94 [Eastern grey kangaroopox virus]ATI21183.1 RAP94 [Eastern grey kangaroopox virus]ATX75089.1 RAP94 [Eastern grey kangaroopox virus]